MKRRKRHLHVRLTAGILAVVVVTLSVVGVFAYEHFQGMHTPSSGPLSRQVMAYTEQLVAEKRIAPPLAALHYAYVASAYDDALQHSGQAGALYAARQMLDMLYPDTLTPIATTLGALAKTNHVVAIDSDSSVSSSVRSIISGYQKRYASDGHALVWDGVIPTGPGKWVETNGVPPILPRAGEWKRWVVTSAIPVPAPPALGSAEDNRQLNIVAQAVAGRNGEDMNLINFWAGSIGTATPSGIWQNQLFKTVQKNLSSRAVSADTSYALIQKNVAQVMSDAFMECWKVKYTYWTARPNMRLPGLVTGMPNPPFPSYISGHSTVSKAAADVLSVMVPQYHDQWETMAAQARYSRLVAGIHFDVDNSVGFDVGTNVATQADASLHLTRVL